MIQVDYVRTMARYNSWQNNAIMGALEAIPEDDIKAVRGVFWGSLLGTVNHLLWGDQIWMSRFDGGPRPQVTLQESPELHPTRASWDADRFRTDGRIRKWAVHLGDLDLKGNMTWYSGAIGKTVEKPIWLCVTHFFNHQTHHRGQVHAILTDLGVKTADSDLFLLPDDA